MMTAFRLGRIDRRFEILLDLKIKRSALAAIAETKMKDLNANDIEAATRIIEGSARAMGLEVVEG